MSNSTSPMIIETLLLIFVVLLVIFLIFREFFTWYWKQNKIVSLLESINDHLERLTDELPNKNDIEEINENLNNKN